MREDRLIKNMTDQVKELQIKLGYARESVRLYYPVSSLNVLLGTKETDIRAFLKVLRKSEQLQKSGLGPLKFSGQGDRIEVGISPEGVEYVYQNVETPAFLTELISLFQKHHHCQIQEICRLFESFCADYKCEKMPEGSDFDYVLYFPDSSVDEYYYCIKEEMGHTIYHRFTKEDYVLL